MPRIPNAVEVDPEDLEDLEEYDDDDDDDDEYEYGEPVYQRATDLGEAVIGFLQMGARLSNEAQNTAEQVRHAAAEVRRTVQDVRGQVDQVDQVDENGDTIELDEVEPGVFARRT